MERRLRLLGPFDVWRCEGKGCASIPRCRSQGLLRSRPAHETPTSPDGRRLADLSTAGSSSKARICLSSRLVTSNPTIRLYQLSMIINVRNVLHRIGFRRVTTSYLANELRIKNGPLTGASNPRLGKVLELSSRSKMRRAVTQNLVDSYYAGTELPQTGRYPLFSKMMV